MAIDLKKILKENKKLKKRIKKKGKKSKGVTKKLKLSKPKAQLVRKLNPVQSAMKGGANTKMVKEGETGWFKKEYIQEKQNFLGRYSLE
ncbi:MAG TPA: hypothetical protein ENG48_02680 [Candidatus Atribacteria bacterium]|nr:hypothetical protein [Candidatus Atribacteria bacterium]